MSLFSFSDLLLFVGKKIESKRLFSIKGDPRGNLKRALKDMRDLGFTSFNLGPEPEFL
ncbi:hypothetical protein EfmJHP36_10230 [Enterococcus faecium]|nr:hypothetical protein EfmJHP36_10230 [Enterococcus faecium]